MDGLSACPSAPELCCCHEVGRARRPPRDGAPGPDGHRCYGHPASRPIRLGRGRRGISKVSRVHPLPPSHYRVIIHHPLTPFFFVLISGTSTRFEASWTVTNQGQGRAIWTYTREGSAFCLETSSRRATWTMSRLPMSRYRIWLWKASISFPDPRVELATMANAYLAR